MIKRKVLIPAAGRILVSEPSLDDFYFQKSVILLADYRDEGSFGIIINKPMKTTLSEAVEGFRDFDPPLYFGGPVETDSLFFIHTVGDIVPGSQKIMEGLYWGGDTEIIKEMIILNQLTTSEIRFFLGYSGWSKNQLEDELRRDSWVVADADPEKIFHTKPQNMWSNTMRSLGDDYAIWSNLPSDSQLN